MNIARLISITASEMPFFFAEPQTRCKVYHDGGHYVAVPCGQVRVPKTHPHYDKTEAQKTFDSLYSYTLIAGFIHSETLNYLRDNLCHLFVDEIALNDFINNEMKRKAFNLYQRKKRFRRKAYLNRWTHFVTITYDDIKMNEETFRQKLRKCLCNLHARRNWRYMGVFERAPETNRLHFHALLCVPDGEMLGELTEKKDYSTKSNTMQTTISNSFFAETFGRNDFSLITQGEMQHGNTIGYLLKYIGKTGERITYSRGIPTEICKEINKKDFAAEMRDFVLKYVLFDDVIDWDTDIVPMRLEQETLDVYLNRLRC